jgi:hypothetical protein
LDDLNTPQAIAALHSGLTRSWRVVLGLLGFSCAQEKLREDPTYDRRKQALRQNIDSRVEAETRSPAKNFKEADAFRMSYLQTALC